MRLVIRADGYRAIGAGHVMRCLALAQAWRRRGGTVTYVAFVDNDAIAARLRSGSDTLVLLERPHPSPGDHSRLLEAAAAHPGAPVVVDGYGFDGTYHRHVRAAGHPLLLLDDHAHLPAYDADWVLNPNAIAAAQPYRDRGSSATLLLGPSYALLRAEFLAHDQWVRPATPSGARRVLVTLGGSDPGNVTLRALHGVAAGLGSRGDAQARVIAGPSSTNAASLSAFAAQTALPCQVLPAVDDMPAHMMWADLAVGAAGVTTWEMAYLQLPALLITTADNQGSNAALAAARGVARDLGAPDDHLEARVANAVRLLAEDGPALTTMAAAGRGLVDGQGAARVAAALAGGAPRDVKSGPEAPPVSS